MENTALAVTFLMVFASANELMLEAKEYLKPPIIQTHRQKWETPTDLLKLIDSKVQHAQTLEDLLLINQRNEDLIKELMENCVQSTEKPKTKDMVEMFLPKRRSNTPIAKEQEDASSIIRVARFGKNIPKYGTLFANLISNEIKNQLEPILEVINETH